jgi:hypothetical protein
MRYVIHRHRLYWIVYDRVKDEDVATFGACDTRLEARPSDGTKWQR